MHRLRPLLRVVALILLTLALPLSGVADEATPGALDPVPDPQVIASQPTTEPLPTSVPPTAVPTPLPTETIHPTEQPLSTQEPSPTEESPSGETPATASETPKDEPDPEIEETAEPGGELPSSTPSETEQPEDTPTPAPNSDSLTLLSAPGDIVLTPGEATLIEFTYNVTTERTATQVHLELRLADGTLATGWSLLLQPGVPTDLPGADLVDATALIPGSSFGLSIHVQAPPTVDEGHTVSLFISSTETSNSGDRVGLHGDTPAIKPAVTPPEEDDVLDEPTATPGADDVSLQCSPDGIGVAGGYGAITVSCTWRGNESLAEREVVLSRVSITAPEGWALTAPPVSDEAILDVEPRSSIGAGDEHVFSFTALPETCETETGTLSISSTLASGSEGDSGSIDGPSATLQLQVAPSPAVAPGVDISGLGFGSSELTDAGYAPMTGSLAITIVSNAPWECASITSGWSIQVGTTGLSGSGRADATIPAERITYLGTQSADGAPTGILPVAADLTLATGEMTTIAFGDSSIGDGVTWNAMFELAPSSDTPVGTYEGGISVMIINGP
jgi:hypothetical protein